VRVDRGGPRRFRSAFGVLRPYPVAQLPCHLPAPGGDVKRPTVARDVHVELANRLGRWRGDRRRPRSPD